MTLHSISFMIQFNMKGNFMISEMCLNNNWEMLMIGMKMRMLYCISKRYTYTILKGHTLDKSTA